MELKTKGRGNEGGRGVTVVWVPDEKERGKQENTRDEGAFIDRLTKGRPKIGSMSSHCDQRGSACTMSYNGHRTPARAGAAGAGTRRGSR